jgi:hypothetical protein
MEMILCPTLQHAAEVNPAADSSFLYRRTLTKKRRKDAPSKKLARGGNATVTKNGYGILAVKS